MEKLKIKFIAIALIIMLSLAIIPMNVFAANENIQIVKTADDKYIIYQKDMADKEFKFATSDKGDLSIDSIELSYTNAVIDEDGNNVALLDNLNSKYLYTKEGTNLSIIELDSEDVISTETIANMEKTTRRIPTELLTNLEEQNEVIDGVQYKQTVGGLKITDDQDATYQFISVRLPSEGYSELKELADELNGEAYSNKDMYSKIEFIKKFNEKYNSLLASVDNWKTVENMEIRQPADAQKDEEYVVFLRKISNDGSIIDDVKFLKSYRVDEEEKIPGRTEIKTVKETAKLPITGDSLILFSVLGIAVIALIIVFVRMKKLQNKGKNK